MDEQTKKQLFEDLGFIKGQLESMQQVNATQNTQITEIDKRLRNQEIKNSGISAFVAVIVSVGVDAIKKGLSS